MKKNIKRKLKIAIFCPTEYATPPSRRMKDIYAPMWLNYYLIEELAKRGHNLWVFAPSDSNIKTKLISNGLISLVRNRKLKPFYQQVTEIRKEELRLKMCERREVIINYDYLLLSKLSKTALTRKFDIVYVANALRFLPFIAICPTPAIFTLHSPISRFRKFFYKEYKKRYPHIYFTALSKSHAKPEPKLFSAIVNNGIETKNFKFNKKPDDYLLVVGRIAKEKGISTAIKIAKAAKKKLVIVGRKTEDEYWYKKVKPYIGKDIKFAGLVPYYEMPKFYKNAKALLFPISWEEPFGLVMIEAMACGTPVIAFKRASVPEVVRDKVTGFICKPNNLNSMTKAVKKIYQMPETEYRKMRYNCRKHVEENFTIEKMVDGYEKVFYKILARQKKIK